MPLVNNAVDFSLPWGIFINNFKGEFPFQKKQAEKTARSRIIFLETMLQGVSFSFRLSFFPHWADAFTRLTSFLPLHLNVSHRHRKIFYALTDCLVRLVLTTAHKTTHESCHCLQFTKILIVDTFFNILYHNTEFKFIILLLQILGHHFLHTKNFL